MARVVNAGRLERKLPMAFSDVLVNLDGRDDIEVPYFNPQTESNSVKGGEMYQRASDSGLNYNPKNAQSEINFSSPEITGNSQYKSSTGGRNSVFGKSDTSQDVETFSSTRMEMNTERPEYDQARRDRLDKINKVRAIAQGALLLRDIIADSNGGFAIGSIGGGEQYINDLAQLDNDYANRLQQWSQENLMRERFNAQADNNDRLINFRAMQDAADRRWREGENEKDREAADKREERLGKRDAAYIKNANSRADKAADDEANKQRLMAIERYQSERNSLQKRLENMKLEEREAQGPLIQKQIDEYDGIIKGLIDEQRGREGYDTPQEPTRPSTPGAPKSMTGMDYVKKYFPQILDKTYNLGGYDYTTQELLDAGYTPEQIVQLNQL